MTEAPIATEQPAYTEQPPAAPVIEYGNYWGTQETHQFTLPDGHQYFTIRPLDEGGKTLHQKTTNKGIRVSQRTQEAHMDIDPASERHSLIKNSVVGYNLMVPVIDRVTGQITEWVQHPFSKPGLQQWLEKADPKIVQELELFIRLKNPWMQDNMTVEEVDQEIDRLMEIKNQIIEREAGEAASASK